MGKKREGPPLAEYVEDRLREYIQWRDSFLNSRSISDKELPYLIFVKSPQRTMREGREVFTGMAPKSGRLNVRLKKYAAQYNEELHLSPTSDTFIQSRLARSHSLGRHVYGTFWAQKIHPKTLIRYMRISDHKGEGWAVARKYINFDRSAEAEEYGRLAAQVAL